MRFSFVCRFDGCWARRFTRRLLNPEPLVRQANLVLLAGCKSLWARSGSSQPPLASVAAIRRRKPNEIVEAYTANHVDRKGDRTP